MVAQQLLSSFFSWLVLLLLAPLCWPDIQRRVKQVSVTTSNDHQHCVTAYLVLANVSLCNNCGVVIQGEGHLRKNFVGEQPSLNELNMKIYEMHCLLFLVVSPYNALLL